MSFEHPVDVQTQPPTVSLSVQSLVFAWPSGRPAWHGWSVDFQPGLTVVVGGDGAGKSTLLRLLAAALQPQAGQLVLRVPSQDSPQSPPNTFSAWPDPQTYRQRVFWCDPASDALDALRADAYVTHHRQQQAAWNDGVLQDLLTDLELSDHLHKPLLGLSMGMRRKLRLACAMASGAPLTLMDEPLAALDRRSIGLVNEMLDDCASSRERVFVSTAYEEPEQDRDRVSLLKLP